jgi:hypothetical protein
MPEAGILRELEEKTALSAEVTNVLSVGSLTQRHLEVALLGSTDSGQTPSFNHEIFDSAFAIPMDLPEGMLLGRKDLVGHAASRLNSN